MPISNDSDRCPEQDNLEICYYFREVVGEYYKTKDFL